MTDETPRPEKTHACPPREDPRLPAAGLRRDAVLRTHPVRGAALPPDDHRPEPRHVRQGGVTVHSPIDDLIAAYADKLQEIYDNKTAGQYTWSGVLGEFARHLPGYEPAALNTSVADWSVRLEDIYRHQTAGAYTFVGVLADFVRAIGARSEVTS